MEIFSGNKATTEIHIRNIFVNQKKKKNSSGLEEFSNM